MPEPELWWPHSLGEQPLHELSCELIVDGRVHDHRSCRTAFRTVRLATGHSRERGSSLHQGHRDVAHHPRPGDATPRQVAADVRAARDAGLDLIRLVAHIAHPEAYRTADELGMLVWQEMPLRGVMARGVRGQAVRQAREMVDLLGHHPSLAVWCVHDEPFRRQQAPTSTPPIVGQQRPSRNRAVLDTTVRRVLQRTDGSRPIVNHTAVPPHLPLLDGTTSLLWLGWHDVTADDLAAAIGRLPRMGRFVTAFGAASVDPQLPELQEGRWPALDWNPIAAAVGARRRSLHHLAPPERTSDGPAWAETTRQAQADVLRTTIETLRKVKYRPTGGFCAFYLADPGPAGGFGVLDSYRRAKPALQALTDACRPVIVVGEPLPASIGVGEVYEIAIHVVSDLHEPLRDGVVSATIHHADGTTDIHRWGGEIEADSVVRIALLSVPALRPGALTVELALTAVADDAENGEITAHSSVKTTVS